MSNLALTAVFYHSKIKGSPRALLLAIADGLNDKTGEYWATVETLSWKCGGLHERNIQRQIATLLAEGELVLIEVPGRASTFMIPLYPGEPGYKLEPCEDDSHVCKGEHTPLSIGREDAKIADVKRARAAAKAQQLRNRGHRGAAESPPLETASSAGAAESPPGGGGIATPPRRNRHRGAAESPPSTHSSTHTLTHTVPREAPPADVQAGEDAADAEGGVWASAPAVWRAALADLRGQMSDGEYTSWFRGSQLVRGGMRPDLCKVLVRTQFQRQMIEQRYRERVADALTRGIGRPISVIVRVGA